MRRGMRSALVAACAAVWLLGGTAAGLSAQPAAQAPAPIPSASVGQAAQNPQDQFVPVKTLPPSPSEQLPAQTLVMAAYAFVWAVLLVYVWTVWRRLLKVEREIRTLAERVADKTARS